MPRLVGFKIRERQPEQTHRRMQPPAILWMFRSRSLFLQMHKRPCKLNEPLEKGIVLVAPAQPQFFEHVMRFIIALRIEACEVASVMRVELRVAIDTEPGDKGGDTVSFFHRGAEPAHYPSGSCA